MRRRHFLTALFAAAVAWPVVARGQQGGAVRRIALLLPANASDPEFQLRVDALLQGLQQAGWTAGGNVQLGYWWTEGNRDNERKHVVELIAFKPDVILADGAGAVGALLQATRTVPIVFPVAGDPVGAGFVDSLARPGGNVTGFLNFEYSNSAKWLELLKELTPDLRRVAVLRDPRLPTGTGQFGVIQAAAAAFKIDVIPVNLREMNDVEQAVASFAQKPGGGLIVTANPFAIANRAEIVELAARHKLPAVYFEPVFVKAGGLVSYGPDIVDQYRRSAGYIDRILKGERPGDLPVQAPTKYGLAINLRTAKALGLTVPATLLARADAVIE